MNATLFSSLEEALQLHQALIEKFGGTKGIRDMGLLESALIRPQMNYYTSLSQQAAALFQSLARNHVFVDGNKRVAFALTAIFLEMNGYSLIVKIDQAYSFIIQEVIENQADVDEISKWLEKHLISSGHLRLF